MPSRPRVVTRAPVVTFAIALVVFGYRGSAASGWVMYLDDVFIQHAVYSDVEYSGIRAILDPLGVFRSFSGYLHLVARLGAAVLTWVGLAYLPFLVWGFATLVWAGCAATIAWAVTESTGHRLAGIASGAGFALAPMSNVILLGQLNALQWPMLAAAAIVAVSGARPRGRVGRIALTAFLVATVLNAALSFLVILVLALRSLSGPEAARERRLFVPAAFAFLPQVYAYLNQEARAVEAHSLRDLLREFVFAFHTFVPSGLRWPYGASATSANVLAVVAWWSVVVASLVWAGRHCSSPSRRRSVNYAATGLAFLVVSVALNGNLNHQYLVVPTVCLLVVAAECLTASRRRLPSIALGVAFAVSSIGLLPRTLNDTFFTQPFVGSWSSALAEARAGCADRSDVVSVAGTSRPLRVPCSRR